MMKWNQNDGGRVEAGFEPTDGACVYRAVAIVTKEPYQKVHDVLLKLSLDDDPKHEGSGVQFHVLDKYMAEHGWKWTNMRRPVPPQNELMPKEQLQPWQQTIWLHVLTEYSKTRMTSQLEQETKRQIEGYYEQA